MPWKTHITVFFFKPNFIICNKKRIQNGNISALEINIRAWYRGRLFLYTC